MRWAVTTSIDQEQRLLGVGQRDHQGVVSPDPVVGQIDALLARGVGGHEGAIGVDDRFLEELRGLLFPDPQPGLVDRVHQLQDIAHAEPPAEIPGRGRIGDPLGAQGIEVDLVVASQFEMLELVSPGQDVEGDVQHVVGLMVRQVPLEQVEAVIDVADQSGLAGHQEHGADPAAGQPLDSIGQLVLDVAGGDHGTFPLGPGTILDATENSSLALPQLVEDIGIHSKASVAWNSEDV